MRGAAASGARSSARTNAGISVTHPSGLRLPAGWSAHFGARARFVSAMYPTTTMGLLVTSRSSMRLWSACTAPYTV